MDIYDFIWVPLVVEKIIVKHQVAPEEVEQVFQGRTMVRSHKGVHVALGQSSSGRYLCVVFKKASASAIKIITAREMTSNERRLYERKA